MRKRSEMPTDEQVLATKLWTLAKYLREHKELVEIFYQEAGGRRYDITDVIDLSDELHPKVIIVMERHLYGQQDTAVEEESRKGDVPSGGHSGQPRAHSSSTGPTTSHSGGPEEM